MSQTSRLQTFNSKPRVFIVSDISNEPDDAESLCRYLLYSNEFDTRGLVACTSNWMKRAIHPEDMEKIVREYSKVVDNLNAHVHPAFQYSSGDDILKLIKSGPKMYGKEALAEGVPLSEGTQLLIDRIDEFSQPLWILCWGGTNVLAQALQHVSSSRSSKDATTFRSKMRVYAISDQDDTGMWIRVNFPDVFYISSVHGWNQYGLAAWTGISGDNYYGFDKGGPDFSKMTKEWIKENIQIGDFGSAYPDYLFIPEGDTPTFLYLIQNGLGSPENPNWGSWGGRYLITDVGNAGKHYTDATDGVIGKDGQLHRSNHATIWRWRDAFQNDFAARMKWTLSRDFSSANHPPVVAINGEFGPDHLYLEAEAGTSLTLDASQTYDPDENDSLTFQWTHYKDITATQWWVDAEVTTIEFEDISPDKTNNIIKITLPTPEKSAVDMFTRQPQEKGQIMHLILAVTDSGTPPITRYKRVVIQITNKDLKGGGGNVLESIADVQLNA